MTDYVGMLISIVGIIGATIFFRKALDKKDLKKKEEDKTPKQPTVIPNEEITVEYGETKIR
jgi:C4-dicarboxylate transporter